jgi:hypothetical protein
VFTLTHPLIFDGAPFVCQHTAFSDDFFCYVYLSIGLDATAGRLKTCIYTLIIREIVKSEGWKSEEFFVTLQPQN